MVAAAPLAAEKLELIQDAVEAVSGDRPTYQACHRWMTVGLLDTSGNRVKLAFQKCGKRRKTSREAVRRFFAALSQSQNTDRLRLTPGDGSLGEQHEAAMADLAAI